MRLIRIAQLNLIPLLIASSAAHARWQLNMTRGVTPISHDEYNLHMISLWICCVIAVIVFGVLFYSIFHHRKVEGRKAAVFHEHLWVEITWTIIPFLILVGMAIPATRVLIHLNNPQDSDLTIRITGYQWKWRYEYLEQGVNFFSNNATPFAQMFQHAPKDADYLMRVDKPLVVPIHKKIRFLMTSNDVIHSWWVPELGVKRDAIPGYITESWARINKPGIYHGQCAELCGLNHAYMPIVVQAVPQQEFDDWLNKQKAGTTPAAATQAPATTTAAPPKPVETTPPSAAGTQATPAVQPATQAAPSTVAAPATAAPAVAATPASGKLTLDDLMKKGETVYLNTCAVCHQPNGEGMPPTFPTLKGSKIITGPKEDHIKLVLNGRPGTAMQAFKDQLTEEDIAAVITYERNSWGNDKKEAIQPDEIKAAKK